MAMTAIPNIRKARGRPATGALGVYVKMPPADLAALDGWIAAQGDAPSRPEAVRRVLKLGITAAIAATSPDHMYIDAGSGDVAPIEAHDVVPHA